MKNIQQNLRRWPVIMGVICVMAFTLSSCLKNHDNDNTPVKSVSALAVIDASPGEATYNFYLNSTLVTASPFSAGTYLTYFTAYSGNANAAFFTSASSAPAAQDTINLAANKYYSLFFANTAAHADFILLQDSVSRPTSGAIALRLVNASPDAGAIDMLVKGSSSKVVQNIGYKGASGFVSTAVTAADTLQIVKAGTSTVLATVAAKTLVSNAGYTVWLYGFATTSDVTQKVAAGIMANAFFTN